MKLVKVRTQWKLHSARMPVALRFDSWGDESRIVETWLKEHHGNESWSYSDCTSQWKSHWGTSRTTGGPRPYFIGLRDESMVSVILLTLNVTLA